MTLGAITENISYDVIPCPTIQIGEISKKTATTDLTKDQLIETIAWIMQDIIQARFKDYVDEDEIAEKTIFHAKTIPSIMLRDYLARFCHYAKCEPDVLIYTLIYLDRIGEKISDFSIDTFNVHKLMLISLSEACKFCDDNYFTNTYYSDVGGISVEEFNILEQEYLVNYLQFDMYVKLDTYKTYYSDIAAYYGNRMSQNEIQN